LAVPGAAAAGPALWQSDSWRSGWDPSDASDHWMVGPVEHWGNVQNSGWLIMMVREREIYIYIMMMMMVYEYDIYI
jgi:hypothetical protein